VYIPKPFEASDRDRVVRLIRGHPMCRLPDTRRRECRPGIMPLLTSTGVRGWSMTRPGSWSWSREWRMYSSRRALDPGRRISPAMPAPGCRRSFWASKWM